MANHAVAEPQDYLVPGGRPTTKPFTELRVSLVKTLTKARSNLTVRMSNRRFTRLTNAFSKKVDNHRHMVALFFFYYNFCRVHSTLRVTPAMEAGLTDHVWSLDEMCAILPVEPTAARKTEKRMVLKALGETCTVA